MRKRRRQQRRLFDDADDFEMDDDLEQECGKSAVKKQFCRLLYSFKIAATTTHTVINEVPFLKKKNVKLTFKITKIVRVTRQIDPKMYHPFGHF